MADPFVGELRLFGFAFAPRGWAFCNGQLLPVAQNTQLFGILGTMYGGDGKSTFGLPNLAGATPVHAGNQPGPGLSQYFPGLEGGDATVTLLAAEVPSHVHTMRAAQGLADANVPGASSSFASSTGGKLYQNSGGVQLSPQALALAGGSGAHNNMQPYLCVNFCIALQGVLPQRP